MKIVINPAKTMPKTWIQAHCWSGIDHVVNADRLSVHGRLTGRFAYQRGSIDREVDAA